MKKISFMIICLFALIITTNVYAATSYVTLQTAVNIRTSPNASSTKVALGNTGSSYDLLQTTIVADEKKDGSCDSGWYNISYNGTPAYVCSEYVRLYQAVEITTEAKNQCEQQMKDAGFPATYWDGLCQIKIAHPTWSFVPDNTGLDWATVIDKESSCGKSYTQSNDESYIDRTCTSAYSSTSSWKPASAKAVAYYMDPRNWLTEKYVFQFLSNKYDTSFANSYSSGVTSIAKGAEFYKYHLNIGTNLGDTVSEAGKLTAVSPIFLAARMLQELGSSTSLYNLYSGVYTGNNNEYYGYYNFFNYGVTDSCATSSGTTYCGLSYAKNQGWNSPLNSIKGASSSLASSYISVGQYTTYYQKYNVVPTNSSKLYLHQYMTNVAAPSGEAGTTYNTYKNLGLLDSSIIFNIPVYNNMTNEVQNTPSGGTGDSGSGTVTTMPVSTVVASAGYKLSGSVLSGIATESSVTDLIGSLQSVSGNGSVKVYDGAGNQKNDGNVGTGYTVSITTTSESAKLTVKIMGDTSGDGKITALDLLQIQKYLLGTYSLNDIYFQAGNTSGDDKITALDLLQVQKHLLGTYNIGQ